MPNYNAHISNWRVSSAFLEDESHLNRIGNFIIGVGVWMSLRSTLRDGINRHKNALDASPVIPRNAKLTQLNSNYFNNITFSIGDAYNQLIGFGLVIFGSVLSSYGDLLFCLFVEFCK